MDSTMLGRHGIGAKEVVGKGRQL